MTKKIQLLLLLILFPLIGNAQYGALSPSAEISILTIGPGEELYNKFGHSAFRVKDSLAGVDVVFNYGVFDFNTPNFYTKFAQGKLLYELGISYYHDFYRSYVAENRWIKEQVLNLNKEEKQAVSDFLWNNALPENKYYTYDFFYDNCATKIRDVLQLTLGDNLVYHNDHIDTEYTFRQLIQTNLKANTWGSLGIDIGLGSVTDQQAAPIEYQFLPEYVYQGAANATINHNNRTEALVKSEQVIFENKPVSNTNNFFGSPLFVFGLFGLGILFVTYHDVKNKTRSRWLDGLLFSITGLIGILLTLLWVATDHTATTHNYNLLWTFPLSIVFAFFILRKHPSVIIRRYVFLLILMLVLLTIHWFSGVQGFAIGLIPLLIALAVRYGYVTYYIGKRVGR